jgi:hypothetical protein
MILPKHAKHYRDQIKKKTMISNGWFPLYFHVRIDFYERILLQTGVWITAVRYIWVTAVAVSCLQTGVSSCVQWRGLYCVVKTSCFNFYCYGQRLSTFLLPHTKHSHARPHNCCQWNATLLPLAYYNLWFHNRDLYDCVNEIVCSQAYC